MKESGYLWLGDIPCDWNTKRIKYIAKLKGRIGWQGLTSDEYQDDGAYLITGTDFVDGEINWESCEHIPYKRWEEATEIQIEEGDLLITKDGTVGKVAIVNNVTEKTFLNSGVLRIIPNDENDRKFLFWVLRSDVFWNWFNYKNAGNSTILHLYQNDFYEFVYAFPKLNEQKIIANFLDERCKRIDGIVADLENQIDKLTSFKSSLIFECVTKGLNKKTELKNSGVEWIGNIPSDWKVKRFKYLHNGTNVGETIDKEFWSDDTNDSVFYSAGEKYTYTTNTDFPSCKYTKNNDLLLSRNGTPYIYIPYNNSQYSDHIIRAKIKTDYDKRYVKYCLEKSIETERVDVVSLATWSVSIWNEQRIVVPSLEEQIEIADYLDEKLAIINEIIDKKQLQLEKIKSNKSSLIYEYVTGKKRVKVGE